MANNFRQVIEVAIEGSTDSKFKEVLTGLRGLGDISEESGAQLAELLTELAKVQGVARVAEQFDLMSAAVASTEAELVEARAGFAALAQEFDRSDSSSKAITRAFDAADKKVTALEATLAKQTTTLRGLGDELTAAGVDTSKLATEQARLAQESAKAEQSSQEQAAALRANAAAAAESAKRWEALGNALSAARARGNELAEGLVKIGAAAVSAYYAAAAYGAVRFFEGGLEDAGAFESALGRVQAAAGLAGEAMVGVKAAIEDTADAASKDVGEAAATFEQLTREGLSAAEAQEQLRTALDFSTVAAKSGAEAVQILGDATGAFNLGAERSASVADLLTESSLRSGLAVGEFAEQMKAAGPAAADANLSIELTAAAMVLLAKNGLEGGRAVGAFNQVVAALRDPASRFSEELTKLGITSRDFGEVMAQLGTRGQAAEAAFLSLGDKGTLVLRALSQNGGESLRQLQEDLERTNGATERAAATINDDYTTSLANVGRAFEEARRKLAEPLLDPLSEELDKFSTAIREFTASDAFAKLQGALVDAFKAAAGAAGEFADSVDWDALAARIGTFATDGAANLGKFAADVGVAIDSLKVTVEGLGIALGTVQTGVFGIGAVLAVVASQVATFVGEIAKLSALAPPLEAAAKLLGVDLVGAGQKLSDVGVGLIGVFDEFGKRAVENANAVRDAVAGSSAATEDAAGKTQELAKAQADAAAATVTLADASQQQAAAQQQATATTEKLTAAQQSAKDQSDALAAAYRVLGIESQQSLDATAASARAAFDTVTAAAARGEATTRDVTAAFEAYARAALNAADNAGEGARRVVEAQLRTLAATVDARDALERLGLAGKEAGDETEDAANRASSALEDVADSADAAAGSVEGLGRAASVAGSASNQLADSLRGAAREAQSTTVSIDGVSEAYLRAVQAQSQQSVGDAFSGNLPRVQQELIRQTEELERQLASVRAQNEAYDETAQMVARLRNQFEFLSDDRLRQLASERLALERNRQTSEANANTDRQLPERTTSPQSPSPDSSRVPSTINFNINGLLVGMTQDQFMETFARQILPILRRLYERGVR